MSGGIRLFKLFQRNKQEEVIKEKSHSIIYMANHVTKQDLTYLHNELPKNVHFIIFHKDEYEANLKNLADRKLSVFPELTPDTLKKIISIGESGEPLLLFPELRISRTGRVMKIYQEFVFVANKLGATIYPVIIKIGDSKSSGLNIANFLEKSPSIHIGKPFTVSDGKERGSWEVYRHLTNLYVQANLKKKVNLFNELLEVSRLYDSQTPIVKDTTNELTYKRLLLTVHVLSARLEERLKDKTVGVLLPSAVGHVVTLFSLFKIGKTPAILNFTMGQQTLIDCCETAGIQTIITSREFIDKGGFHELVTFIEKHGYTILYLEDVKETINSMDKIVGLKNHASSQRSTSADNEVILFTSGSENKPKGVILTHDHIYANIQQAMSVMDLDHRDRMLNPLPMFHSFGLTIGTFLPILSGISLVIYPSPIQYKVIPELVYQEDITLLLSTPTFLNGYGKNADPYDLHTLRYAIAGAENVKEETKELFYEKFGIRILEGYGATEASPLVALNTPIYTKAGSVGKLIPGLQFKVEKVEGIENGGSLLIKGPNVMKGYLIHGKGFVPHEEWYNTGDVVEIDELDYVTIKSRLKRFAKVGGEMVSLNLVEKIAMESYDEISFAAVSVPDKRKGEKIILFTSLEDVNIKDLKKYIKTEKYSPLLTPTEIVKIDEIPLLGSGKTDYVSLENRAANL